MKFTLVSTWNIENNYTAVPYLVYEYAKYLFDNGMDTEILIPTTDENPPKVKNYKLLRERYKRIPKRIVERSTIRMPQWHTVILKGLPTDSVVYLSNNIYDSILNILNKPKGQPYIIGCHSMFITKGSASHETVKRMRNGLINGLLATKRRDLGNVYFHVINKEQAGYLKDVFNIKDSKIFYVPNMIEAANYSPGRNTSRRLKVLHIGGMIKDMPIVLDVIAKLSKKKQLDWYEFYFVGRGIDGLRNEYKKFGNVHILGAVGDKEKFKLMAEMDVMIIPGTESFSVTMLEGLASGLYILTSKKTTTWADMRDLGIKLDVTANGSSEDYIRSLAKLAGLKGSGKEMNPYRAKNRQITIEEFGTKSVLPKILEMFKAAARHR